MISFVAFEGTADFEEASVNTKNSAFRPTPSRDPNNAPISGAHETGRNARAAGQIMSF
jgi:hypothetical protein